MAPRSALDVLVDLNDHVTSGNVGGTNRSRSGSPARQDDRLRPAVGRAPSYRQRQGTGKTTMALQMGRNVASGGQADVLYICFEHEEQYLLNRLIAMESALAHLPTRRAPRSRTSARRSSGRG
jgi:hypothetical protein